MKLNEIKPNKANPRVIKDDKFKKLVRSLQSFPQMMQKRPIVVDSDMTILGGNMRYKALVEIYGKSGEIPDEWVTTADGWTDEQKREFIIKDNASYGEWAVAELLDDWSREELDEWGVDVPEWDEEDITETEETKEDDFDEEKEQVETICQSGDIFQLGEHRLMCGDSTKAEDVAKLMQGELAQLWLTDPPYNVAIENSQGMTIANDSMGNDEFREFLHNAFAAALAVLDNGCPFYVWFASREHINFEGALNDVGLRVRQELIWNKNALVLGRSHYQWKHEPCLYGWKGDNCRYFINSRKRTTVWEDGEEIEIDKMKKADMQKLLHDILDNRTPTTVIDCNKPVKDADHPTMKPVRLFGYQMANSSRPGDIILDSFGGSGTTIVAAEQLGRKARLMEYDPHYCDVIIARWEKLTGKKAIRI